MSSSKLLSELQQSHACHMIMIQVTCMSHDNDSSRMHVT